MGKIENAPSGRPLEAKTSAMISALIGVELAGFKTNGQPATIAGAILCAVRLSGKLKGLINEHKPIGTRWVMPR